MDTALRGKKGPERRSGGIGGEGGNAPTDAPGGSTTHGNKTQLNCGFDPSAGIVFIAGKTFFMKPPIHILDAHTTNPGDLSWDPLSALGILRVHARTRPDERIPRALGARILLTNKVHLDADVVAALPELKLVCLMSTGTNAVDLAACTARGIPVCNVPAYGTASVAELVFALLLGWARGAETHQASVRRGDWARCPDFSYGLTPQRELAGQTLGLLGFGDIGQAVARIAIAFGMRVLAHTPHPAGKPALGQDFVDMDRLLRESDVLSLHCPLTEQTRHVLRAETFSRMKEGALLVNTGRGALVDEAALARALAEGRIAAAFLDVLGQEPPPADHPLVGAPNCHIVPHIGWATREARRRLIDCLAGNVSAWLQGKPRHVVNGVP